MPTSEPYSLSLVLETVMDLKPESVLDIGCGFGKYGVLFREYLDIWHQRYYPNEWKIRIDAIEVFEDYITPLHQYIYDNIYIGDAGHIDNGFHYQLVFIGDVIEHFLKAEGKSVIERQDADFILISTPPCGHARPNIYMGNEYEKHRYMWNENDFEFNNWDVVWKKYSGLSVPGKNPAQKTITVLLARKK